MPQSFQVLKCFKCSVFQVHPIKKSNKWDCKLCGQKQSIKRHYGLGTGKECRLHVQKLNSIRGEVDEMTKLDENSDEELPKDELIDEKKQTNFSSKWSEYVDKTEDVKEPEPEYYGNAEVVLEIPAKRRRFQKPNATKIAPAKKLISTAFSKIDCFNNVHEFQSQMSQESDSRSDGATTKNTNEVEFSKQTDSLEAKPELKAFVPHVVDKTSKWAQFAGDDENYNCDDLNSYDDDNDENTPIINDVGLNNNVNVAVPSTSNKSTDKNLATNIFSLCDENDFDDVLDF